MFTRVGKAAYKANLDNTHALMNALGHPEVAFRSVHLAGTNGKGSVSHYLASIFQEAGYKTGLYTSPHLQDFRERIRINGVMIPEQVVVDFVNQYKSLFDEIQPSFFEWSVALCFHYFREAQIDIAIIETGLGGRLDSTNVIHPLLSVITNIGLDHTDLLGDTLEKIAAEKAGIIKYTTPSVLGEGDEKVRNVFVNRALELGSSLTIAEDRYELIEANFIAGKMSGVLYDKLEKRAITQVNSQLGGMYQLKNIATVFAALDFLKIDFTIEDKNILTGIEKVVTNTGLLGRWQILGQQPLIVADIAHNKEGVLETMKQVAQIKYRHAHLVWGMVSDKDITGVLSILPKQNATYYFCKADLPRALSAQELYIKAQAFELQGNVYHSVKEAVNAAKANAQSEDFIYIGGSNFVVAEALAD
jgi:dihydrofolate synthase/folylpolyglutamate synthase